MRRPEQLIGRAIDLLHKARGMLEQTGAGRAVADLERAIASATFARGAVLQVQKIVGSVALKREKHGKERQTGQPRRKKEPRR
jgi:hypothetical protein